MTIVSSTDTTVTCDKCGKAIAAGEPWYQLSQSAARGAHGPDGVTLAQAGETCVQLCETDYQASQQVLSAAVPLAELPQPETIEAAPAAAVVSAP